MAPGSHKEPGVSGKHWGFPVQSQIPKKTSVTKSAIKGAAAQIRAKTLSSKKASEVEERDARRRQKAERQRQANSPIGEAVILLFSA